MFTSIKRVIAALAIVVPAAALVTSPVMAATHKTAKHHVVHKASHKSTHKPKTVKPAAS